MSRSSDGISIDDALQQSIGEFGREQRRLYLLLNVVSILAMLQIYAMVFTELNPLSHDSWACTSLQDTMCQKIYMEQKNIHDVEMLTQRFCEMQPNQWEWTKPHISIVAAFHLQCSTWKISIVDGMFFAGVFIGSSMFGYLSDKLGRRNVMFLSMATSGIGCILTSMASSYWWYLIFRTATGVGSGGAGLTSFVLISELIGPSKRGRLLIALQIFSTIGSCLVTGLGYAFPNWRFILIVIGTLSILYIITWDATLESPRWLLIKGRKGEATAVLAALASGNGTRLPDTPLHDMIAIPSVSNTFGQILRHSVLRGWLFVTLLAWGSVSFAYYGLSMVTEFIPGSIYTTFLATIAIEFPSVIFYMLMVDKVGRKPLFTWGFIIGGIACGLISIAPPGFDLFCAVVCRFAINGVFGVAYLYTSEIFPTVVRNATIGYASSAARVGGILASFVPVTGRFFGSYFPFLILGVMSVCAGIVSCLLPETLGLSTLETIEDMDQMFSSKKSKSRRSGYERLQVVQQTDM